MTVNWLVIDCVSGTIDWQKQAANWWETLEGCHRGILIIKQFSNVREPVSQGTLLLNMVDGQQIEKPTSNFQVTVVPHIFSYPQPFKSDDFHYETICQFIKLATQHQPVETIEYGEINNHVVISYYYVTRKELNQAICVIDKNRKLLLSEPLANNLSGLAAVSFLISDKNLYFVKNKHKFVLINFD